MINNIIYFKKNLKGEITETIETKYKFVLNLFYFEEKNDVEALSKDNKIH